MTIDVIQAVKNIFSTFTSINYMFHQFIYNKLSLLIDYINVVVGNIILVS